MCVCVCVDDCTYVVKYIEIGKQLGEPRASTRRGVTVDQLCVYALRLSRSSGGIVGLVVVVSLVYVL